MKPPQSHLTLGWVGSEDSGRLQRKSPAIWKERVLWSQKGLGSDPRSAPCWLGDLGQVTSPLREGGSLPGEA